MVADGGWWDRDQGWGRARVFGLSQSEAEAARPPCGLLQAVSFCGERSGYGSCERPRRGGSGAPGHLEEGSQLFSQAPLVFALSGASSRTAPRPISSTEQHLLKTHTTFAHKPSAEEGGKGGCRPESLKVQAKNRRGTLRAARLCDLLQGLGAQPSGFVFSYLFTKKSAPLGPGDPGSRPGSAIASLWDLWESFSSQGLCFQL